MTHLPYLIPVALAALLYAAVYLSDQPGGTVNNATLERIVR